MMGDARLSPSSIFHGGSGRLLAVDGGAGSCPPLSFRFYSYVQKCTKCARPHRLRFAPALPP